MARRSRPASASLIAVVNILLGLPCLCCSGAMTVSNGMDIAEAQQAKSANVPGQAPAADENDENDRAAPANPNDPFEQFGRQMEEQSKFLEKEVPNQVPINLATGIGWLVASLLLMVSGVLLLMGRSSGRTLCLISAGLLLISSLVGAVHDAVVVYPAAQRFDAKKQREQQAKGQAKQEVGMATGLLFTIGASALLGIGYPLLACAVMMSAPVRDYYRSRPGGDDEFDRYAEDDFDRPPPRYDDERNP